MTQLPRLSPPQKRISRTFRADFATLLRRIKRRRIFRTMKCQGIDRSEFQYYKETNKGRGRLETREIWSSTQMNGFFEKDWPGIAQVWMIKRTVKEEGEERIEIVYGMTNLPRKKADAKRLLELNRKHWAIENRLLTPS